MDADTITTTGWLQAGGLGFIALCFLGLLRWMMGRFDAHMRNQTRAIDVLAAAQIGFQQQLLAHDLTVTGINPAAGANLNERAEGALAKYEELQRQLEQFRLTILQGKHHEEESQSALFNLSLK
ncbi:MAG: hypothetical protein AAF581_19480 [Planctomycetota bacterium]